MNASPELGESALFMEVFIIVSRRAGFPHGFTLEIDLWAFAEAGSERVRDRWFVDVRAVSEFRHLEQIVSGGNALVCGLEDALR